jgi:opacity protein-like surface antigen
MFRTAASRIFRTISLIGLTVALLFIATAAGAQNREGRWEFTLGTFYQLGITVDAASGDSSSTIDMDDEFGFALGGGYNLSDKLAVNFGLQWAGVGYDALVNEPGSISRITGSYDQFTLGGNLILNLMDGPISPYVGAGLGWTWIDTNIPDGPPVGGCWLDPWLGYVCYSTYPTKVTDAFSYQLLLGVRWELNNDMTFLRLGYTSQWMDFSNADGSPRFDVIALDVGWMF